MKLFSAIFIGVPCVMGATIIVVPSVVAATQQDEPIPPQPEPIDTAFETCSWDYLNQQATALEKQEITQEQFCQAFTINGVVPTSIEQFIGLEKKVQLEHQDLDHDNDANDYLNGNEVAQTIRVIGTCVDDENLYQVNEIDTNGTKAVFTFEFVDVISDSKGYSLATLWNDVSNTDDSCNDYFNTTVRKNIIGLGKPQAANWYLKGEATHTKDPAYLNKTVLDMLPDALANSLKSPQNRFVNKWVNNEWQETSITDKLFLPAAIEIEPGYDGDRELGMLGYKYYSDEGDADSNRIKHQIKGSEGSAQDVTKITDKLFSADCESLAGWDHSSQDHPEYGTEYWLSSPYTLGANHNIAWYTEPDGMTMVGTSQFRFAAPIAPFFCI